MENLRQQLDELFSRPRWTELEYARFLDLVEKCSPSELQSFFVENYIDHLAKMRPDNPRHASELLQRIHDRLGISAPEAPVVSINRRRYWPRIAVAASVILFLGIGSYFLFNKTRGSQQPLPAIALAHDVKAPQANRATITLAGGQKIFLDSAGNGTLATQNNVSIIKNADGQIAYRGSATETVYNTLTNPRGSKVIDMALADGSRVWLNAGSSVTYPVAFTGNERKVSISGEAYFEVTHDASKSFIVSKGDMNVRVLGTHFNVNAYDDEHDIRVTLLEGAVKVSNGKSGDLLKPGQQAQVSSGIKVVNGVDTGQVMAWKEGYFQMKGTDLSSLMRQIARWYDIEVTYESAVPKTSFGGSINRDVNLSDVLKALEQYGIKSSFNNGKIIIE